MYNFSGLLYRIWGVCGFILILGIVLILCKKPWRRSFKISKCRFAIVVIVFAICLSLVYVYRILFPDISVYSGEFVRSYRNSRVAPPLPFTTEYVFWDGTGKKKGLYLDSFSKKTILTDDFEKGHQYTIYFDDFTDVIVKVEEVK